MLRVRAQVGAEVGRTSSAVTTLVQTGRTAHLTTSVDAGCAGTALVAAGAAIVGGRLGVGAAGGAAGWGRASTGRCARGGGATAGALAGAAALVVSAHGPAGAAVGGAALQVHTPGAGAGAAVWLRWRRFVGRADRTAVLDATGQAALAGLGHAGLVAAALDVAVTAVTGIDTRVYTIERVFAGAREQPAGTGRGDALPVIANLLCGTRGSTTAAIFKVRLEVDALAEAHALALIASRALPLGAAGTQLPACSAVLGVVLQVDAEKAARSAAGI